MKKIVSFALTGLMVVGIAGSALAADTTAAAEFKVKDLPAYQELVNLRADGKAIWEQIMSERQEIKPLVQEAWQSKNEAVLTSVKDLRPEAKQLREELQQLRSTQKNNAAALKEAYKAGDQNQAESILNQIVTTRRDINDKLTQIKAAEDQILQTLQ